jgi:hypothetical protein
VPDDDKAAPQRSASASWWNPWDDDPDEPQPLSPEEFAQRWNGPAGNFPRTRHLRLTLGVSGIVLVLATVVGAIVGGGVGALGAAAGVLLVVASYTVTTLAIAWADRITPHMVFAVGVGVYITKFTLLAFVLIAVNNAQWSGRTALAIGIVVGVIAWTTAQIWWTTHQPQPADKPAEKSVEKPAEEP